MGVLARWGDDQTGTAGRNNSLDAAVQIIAQRTGEMERDLPAALTHDAEPAD
jgi:hypothetical protein